jgi:hypothetical protein
VCIETEVGVRRRLDRDDGLTADLAPAFFDHDLYAKLPEETIDAVATGTKLGSVPAWIQSPAEAPAGGWRFLFQLDSTHDFRSPVPTPDEVGCQVARRIDGRYVYEEPRETKSGAPAYVVVDDDHYRGRNWTVEGPNYGDAGTAYVFLRVTGELPEGWFFWQCG